VIWQILPIRRCSPGVTGGDAVYLTETNMQMLFFLQMNVKNQDTLPDIELSNLLTAEGEYSYSRSNLENLH